MSVIKFNDVGKQRKLEWVFDKEDNGGKTCEAVRAGKLNGNYL